MHEKNPSPQTRKPKEKVEQPSPAPVMEEEINGFKALGLPEPTRYKDWEVKGRCSDF